jgi:hypothetical protein
MDDVWKWLGFERKGKAKELLINNFKENEDFKIEKTASATTVASFNPSNG